MSGLGCASMVVLPTRPISSGAAKFLQGRAQLESRQMVSSRMRTDLSFHEQPLCNIIMDYFRDIPV